MFYRIIGKKEELEIVGVGDASFKQYEKAVGGVILLLVNKDLKKASPIYWKAKQIERVYYSSKDAKTLILSKFVEDAVFAAIQMGTLMFGGYERRIPIHFFTDSRGTLESIAWTKQVDRKFLCMVI